MDLSPHVSFNGQCAEAFRFYEQTLGGKVVMMMTHGESPAKDQVSPDWRDKVLHARFEVGGRALMGMDAPPGRYQTPQGNWLSVSVPAAAEAQRIFAALAAGGTIVMPFEKTFWSPGFGMAVDRFGVPWMVGTDQAA